MGQLCFGKMRCSASTTGPSALQFVLVPFVLSARLGQAMKRPPNEAPLGLYGLFHTGLHAEFLQQSLHPWVLLNLRGLALGRGSGRSLGVD